MRILLSVFWLFLPAGIANMAPVLVKRIPFLNTPVWEKRLGKNKTWRGVVFGTIAGIVTLYIQVLLFDQTRSIALLDYRSANVFTLGFLFGGSALLGDIIGSFAKRWIGIPPGEPFVVVDQIDWILTTVIVFGFFYNTPPEISVLALIVFGGLHPIINLIGYALRIKTTRF